MGFFKKTEDWEWLDEKEDDIVEAVNIAKLIREKEGIQKEIKDLIKGELDLSNDVNGSVLEKILERLGAIEKKQSEIESNTMLYAKSSSDINLFDKILTKKKEYQDIIYSLDNQINSEYGRAYRSGLEVDTLTIEVLEKEVEEYKRKMSILEPIADVLAEM